MELSSIAKIISVLPKDRLYKFEAFVGVIFIGISLVIIYFSSNAFLEEAKEIFVANSIYEFDLNSFKQRLSGMKGEVKKLENKGDELVGNALTCFISKDPKQLKFQAYGIIDELDVLETELNEIEIRNSSIGRHTVEMEAEMRFVFYIFCLKMFFAIVLLAIGASIFIEGCSSWKNADDSNA